MQNTKRIKFEQGVDFFSGEDRFLVSGQVVRIGLMAPWKGEWEYEDYVVAHPDEVSGAIVVRRSGTPILAILSRTSMLDHESASVEYYGMEVDDAMVFPGEMVVVETNDGSIEAEFICSEDNHDLVRVREIVTGEVGSVPYDAISKKPIAKEYVKIGEWVLIDGSPYIVAMIDCESWALIGIETGNRFMDPEKTVRDVKESGGWVVEKGEIVRMVKMIDGTLDFCGKMQFFHGEM